MVGIRIFNDILAFTLEMAMLIALGFSGYALSRVPILRITLALVMPAVAIILWAYFAAPKSAHRLEYPIRIFFELLIFLVAATVLYRTGYHKCAIWLASVAMLNEILALFLHR